MANRLLRNIAVTIGAGLAAGIGLRLASRQPRRSAPNLHPILSRLEAIESRVSRVEFAPSLLTPQAPEEIAALGTLVSSQSEDIALLREDILRIERRNTEQAEAFGQKVALLEQLVPSQIEASVTAKMAELERKLRGEFQDIHHRTVDTFADTIEQRVIGRIVAIENSLIAQSHSIGALRDKSLKTDDHLQRLLEAVEKLCQRAETQSQIALMQLDQLAPAPALPASPLPPALVNDPLVNDARVREILPVSPLPVQPEPVLIPQALREPPGPHPTLVAHNQNALDREVEIEPHFAHVNGNHGKSSRGLKPMGMAILGLAVLGFRLIR